MTFSQLRCFLAMAEQLSFSAVAQSLYISQTAVTYHIQALEKELGVPLFRRTTRKVELTAAGRRFCQDIRQAVQDIDAAYERVRTLGRQDRFVFAYSALCGGSCFQKIVREFSDLHPGLSVLLSRTEPEDGLLEQLQAGGFDAALFIDPFPTMPDGVQALDFGLAPRAALISAQHPLAAAGVLSADELPAGELLISEGIERIGRQSNLQPAPGQGATPKDLESLFSMVQANLGIAILPMLEGVERSGLVCLPVRERENSGAFPRITLAWRRGDGSPLVEDLVEIASRQLTGYLFQRRRNL